MSEKVASEQLEKGNKFNTEWLKTFEGFENHTEEEAEEELSSLKKLAKIVCQHLVNTS